MTGSISPAIPVVNSPDSSEEPKIPSAIITLRDALNAVLTSANILDGAQIAAGTVGTSPLAGGAVTTAKLADDAVTNAKVANNAVDWFNIVADAVHNTHIATDAVDSPQIVDGAVGTAELATNAVTSAKVNLTSASVAVTGADVGIAGSAAYQDIVTTTSLAVGTYFVTAVATVSGNTVVGRLAFLTFKVNGTDQNSANGGLGSTDGGSAGSTAISQVLTVTGSPSAIILRAKPSATGGTFTIGGQGQSHLSYVRIA